MTAHSPVRKTWSELSTAELYGIVKLRTDVFYLEQKVDEEELDWRDAEPATVHYWLTDEAGTITAYLRVLTDAQPEHLDARHAIGRVVTHPLHRGKGLAQVLLTAAVEEFGHEAMLLHAQSYVAGLYARVGFEAFGEEYLEAGIPHLSMYRPGSAAQASAAGSAAGSAAQGDSGAAFGSR
ncbi:GNAT family N-acetyltransferase [Herbiconiux sp. KACC 21604]|uniref:GNAT family N-acetyltransferase n=1 Tax=unclassified Herbiconiux TaxID=2618217 RepID=UPI001492D9D2|nr:GNAT family N-acetyltransferase [Herbiconiux sp. SALV-R1]QJU52531.1 GNAT family N-acetyltransferase [Herbiconiux sp. SALV-R1]WPO87406.1 GNAT family N-acetyltransferase [Herbiconiux sp. KACC 21604]